MTQCERCGEVLALVERYGGIDGDHHKAWLLDQLVRLLVDDYDAWVAAYCDGEDGPDTYGWEAGTPP